MHTQTLYIYPFDTVYFRDGKSFMMGEETTSSAVFPPYPTVIYGMLRANYFVENVTEFAKVNKEDDPSKALTIHQFQLQIKDGETLFPIPLDMVSYKKNEGQEEFIDALQVKPVETLISNYAPKCTHLLTMKESKKTESLAGKAFLCKSDFEKYLKNPSSLDAKKVVKLADYITYDSKVGIGRNRETYITEEGKLYRMQYIRMMKQDEKDIAKIKELIFRVNYEGISLKNPKLSKIGAEAKGAMIKIAQDTQEIETPSIQTGADKVKFKIYLATPAIFSEGGIPDKLLADNHLTLLVAAIGKPLSIGGYDMVKKEPKVMRKAVPAGSVYFVEATAEAMNLFVNKYHKGNAKFTDYLEEEGYGWCFVGNIQS